MNKPDWCTQEIWDKAAASYEAMPLVYDGWDETEVVSCIARAIIAATEAERERWAPAVVYFDRYCQDEAEDVENCVCGRQQHEDALAFAAIRNRTQA